MKYVRITIITIITLALFLFAGYDISYNNPIINTISIDADQEVSARLLILSDLHDRQFGTDNEQLMNKVKESDADIILIIGDMLNDTSENADNLMELLADLTELAPVYYALGNHEYGYMEQTDEMLPEHIADLGVTVLEKSYEDIVINGQAIRIGGLYDYAFALDGNNTTIPEHMDPEVYEFLMTFQDTDAYKLMLAHRPDSFILGDASKTWDIDLVISGHLHGGQVVFPFFGGFYGGDQGFFPEYVHGLYEKDLLQIMITSGLSTNKKALPRWNNPPELMLVEVQ